MEFMTREDQEGKRYVWVKGCHCPSCQERFSAYMRAALAPGAPESFTRETWGQRIVPNAEVLRESDHSLGRTSRRLPAPIATILQGLMAALSPKRSRTDERSSQEG